MRLLLDTHALLWWLGDPDRLTPSTRAAVADPASKVEVSAATIWEIEIKRALGKLDVPDDVLHQVSANDFDLRAITGADAVTAARLPRHHDDPFDRILVAQAILHDLTLVTRDARIPAYDVPVLRA